MSSIQAVNVRFPALLEQPPVDRVRKRGLVYPKLAQSKGCGDRMHSPDLFWGTRRVSAAPPGPDPREAVPRGGNVHLTKPAAVTLPGILTLCIPDGAPRRTSRSRSFEPPRYDIMGNTSESEFESWAATTRPGPPPSRRSGIYRLCCSLGSSILEGGWTMRGRSSRCTGSNTVSVTPTGAMIEVEFEHFVVPSLTHFPSTPISSYSSETSTSDRDSEGNSSVAI